MGANALLLSLFCSGWILFVSELLFTFALVGCREVGSVKPVCLLLY